MRGEAEEANEGCISTMNKEMLQKRQNCYNILTIEKELIDVSSLFSARKACLQN